MSFQIKKSSTKSESSEELLKVVFKHLVEDKQIVLGEVYAPHMVDTDWEAMTPDEIEDTAHKFLKNNYLDRIDIGHNLEKSGAVVVENTLNRPPFDPMYSEYAWIMGVWVPDDVWKSVKSGELNAFSFYGTSTKQPVSVVVDIVTLATGNTEEGQSSEKDIESHKHTYVIRLNEKGSVVSGYTSFDHNHQHTISLTSATEKAMEHAHRYFVE